MAPKDNCLCKQKSIWSCAEVVMRIYHLKCKISQMKAPPGSILLAKAHVHFHVGL